MKQAYDLANKPIGKLLLSYFIPAFIGVVVNALYNIVDRVFIGRIVGADALNGVSLIFPIMLVNIAFGMLIGIGTSVLVSINLGKGDKAKAENLLGNSFVMMLFTSAVLTIAGFAFKTQILELLGATEKTISYANEYLDIILYGVVFQMVGFSLNNIIRAEGNANIAMESMLISAVTNIILDAVFVYWLDMGVKGAAYATVISMLVLSIWVTLHFRSSRSNLRLHILNLSNKLAAYKEIFKAGLAPFSMQAAGALVQFLTTKQLLRLGGDMAVGAMGIVISISTLIIMSVIAINMAGQPIMGYNYGAKLYGRVKECLRLSVYAATVICLISFVAIEFFPHVFVNLFNTESQELIDISTVGLRISLCSLPIIGVQIIAGNFYQSIGKSNTATILSLLRQVIILIPMLLILPIFWGLDGLWIAMPISDVLAATIVFFYLRRDWKELSLKV